MKLLNVNKYLLFFLGWIFCSFQNGINPVEGIWIYKKITKNNVSLASLTDNDTLLIRNNQFKYDIESLNKHEHGNFQWIQTPESALTFEYQNSENQVTHTRTFKIVKLSEDSLVIEEGPLRFHYFRKK